jgi:8-oxo-dGTP diphosphatase/2-hydroxy-dATP diphosphatase
MKRVLTLCIVHQHPRVLLGMKKRGFGVGRWNGFGGKVEEDESIEESIKREIKEEAGVEVKDLSKVGILDFEFQNNSEKWECHIFKAGDFIGELIETEEMRPQWFHIDEIPFDKMWTDDLYWMPLFLKNKKFKGKFVFDRPSDIEYSAKILEKELKIVEEI